MKLILEIQVSKHFPRTLSYSIDQASTPFSLIFSSFSLSFCICNKPLVMRTQLWYSALIFEVETALYSQAVHVAYQKELSSKFHLDPI